MADYHRNKKRWPDYPYGKKSGIFVDNDRYPLDFAKCGTIGNYRAHARRGQDPCERCKAANREYRQKNSNRREATNVR